MAFDVNTLTNGIDLDQEVDLTKEQEAGGFEQKLLDSGVYLGRFCSYIETGAHKSSFDPEKPAKPTMRLGIAVFDGDDESPVLMNTFDMQVSAFPKSKCKAAFDAFNWKGTAKHFAQLLNQPYLFSIKKVKTKKGTEVNNIELEKTQPAIDPVGKKPYPVKELDEKFFRLFLYNQPTREGFDGLPKFLQEQIVGATNYEGSAVQEMLEGPQQKAQAAPVSETKKEQAVQEPVQVPEMPELPDMDDEIPF